MDQRVQSQLNQEEPTAFHAAMLAKCNTLVAASRKKMAEYYPVWDMNDEIYRSKRRVDKEDVKASERGEPVKMVVPLSYAQVETFVSFCFGVYTQREKFFELLPMGPENVAPAKVGEAFLQRDLSVSVWEARLNQFLTDVAKYGLGIVKTRWVKETELRLTAVPQLGGAAVHQMVPITTFLGNRVSNVSPYQFFPDPAFTIARFQDGEFCATEEVWSRFALKNLEADGEIAGLKWVPNINKRMLETRGNSRVYGLDRLPATGNGPNSGEDASNVIITEVQLTVVPSETILDDKPLGEETRPVKYVVWIANDARVIKCEPMNYPHGLYTYDIGEFSPDMLNHANDGLQDPIHLLQDTVTWLINSRVTNVRKIITGRMVVDPTGVEIEDINRRLPVIRLKPSAAKLGVDHYVKQLDQQDVTTSHIADAEVLQEFIKVVTGINDTLMGQIYPGRRSATENRNASNASAGRIRKTAVLLYRTALEPMGRKMLANLRVGLDEQQVVRLVGIDAAVDAAGMFVKADRTQLIGDYDFEMFDGTMPSERVMNAQALGEVLTQLIGNPASAIALRLDPQAVLLEYLELRGIRHPRRFLLPQVPQLPGTQNGPSQQQPQGPPGAGPASGSPGFDPQSLLSGIGVQG